MLEERLKDAASISGASQTEIIRRALAQYFASGSPLDYRNREIMLSPRGGSTVDTLLEWMLSRRPRVGDFVDADNRVLPALRKAIHASLDHEMMARRLMMRLQGHTLAAIAQREGCSKQAVHQVVHKATALLGQDRRFIQVLCDMTESDFTADELMAIHREIP